MKGPKKWGGMDYKSEPLRNCFSLGSALSSPPQNNLQNVCQQPIPPNDPAMWITLIHLVAKDIVVSSSHAARILRPVCGHGHGKLPLRIPQDVGTAAGSLPQCLRERRGVIHTWSVRVLTIWEPPMDRLDCSNWLLVHPGLLPPTRGSVLPLL